MRDDLFARRFLSMNLRSAQHRLGLGYDIGDREAVLFGQNLIRR